MVPEDMQILVMGQMGSDEVTGCLIDPMPGGSGLLEQLVVRFQEIRDEAIKIVQTCPSPPASPASSSARPALISVVELLRRGR